MTVKVWKTLGLIYLCLLDLSHHELEGVTPLQETFQGAWNASKLARSDPEGHQSVSLERFQLDRETMMEAPLVALTPTQRS